MAPKIEVSVFLVVLLVGGVAFGYFGMANAESSIPKPSVPEFTVSYVRTPFEIAPTYAVDSFTGKTEMTRPGSSGIAETLEVKITNQFFISHQTSDGNYTELCYCIRAKGHYAEWPTYDYAGLLAVNSSTLIQASDSDYTLLSFPLNLWNVKPGGQIDFQVRAVIANFYYIGGYDLCSPRHLAYEIAAEGDWSTIQTITIPGGSVSPSSPNPTAAPTSVPTISPTSSPPPTTSNNNAATNSNQAVSADSTPHSLNMTEITIAVLLGSTAALLVFMVVFLRRRVR